jgi:hypothetical protein
MTFQRMSVKPQALPTPVQTEQAPVLGAGKVKAHTSTSKKGKKYQVKEYTRAQETNRLKKELRKSIRKEKPEHLADKSGNREKSSALLKQLIQRGAEPFGHMSNVADREATMIHKGKKNLADVNKLRLQRALKRGKKTFGHPAMLSKKNYKKYTKGMSPEAKNYADFLREEA